jgi:hypothetical protein
MSKISIEHQIAAKIVEHCQVISHPTRLAKEIIADVLASQWIKAGDGLPEEPKSKKEVVAKWEKSLGMQGMNYTMVIRAFRIKVLASLFRSYWWIEYMGAGNYIQKGDEETLDEAKEAAIKRFNINIAGYDKIVLRETNG